MRRNLLFVMLIVLISSVFPIASFAEGNSEIVTLSCDTKTNLTKSFIISTTTDINVDWGDGVVETIAKDIKNENNRTYCEHTYSKEGKYIISVTATNIKDLIVSPNHMYEIDVSKLTELEYLNVSNNELAQINLDNNLKLVSVDLSNNILSSLKILSDKIINVITYSNNIETIDINKNVKLLDVKYNKIKNIDLTELTNLEHLDCLNNEISNLNLETCTLLKVLNFSNNNVSKINLRNNVNLEELYCFDNGIKQIDISNNKLLKVFECRRNKINLLDLTQNLILKELYCFDNEILDLDLLNLELERVIVDNNVNILNNNSKRLIKLKYSGNGVVVIGSEKAVEFYPNPKKVFVNNIEQEMKDNRLDITEYMGENVIEVIFNSLTFDVVNKPKLVEGMIPVKYNGTNWVITSENDIEWYNYSKSNMKWANVMLRDGAYYLDLDGHTLKGIENTPADQLVGREVPENYTGSMYVWIPRYTYKISENSIDIKYSSGVVDDLTGDYKVHPAFNYASYKGNDKLGNPQYINNNLKKGLWVAKYPASRANSNVKYAANLDEIKDLSIGEAFTQSKLVGTSSLYGLKNTSSHMMKNTEWGAVAYLAKGIGNLSNDSTTGNIYGIYGMNEGAEYVSSFVELVGGISNFSVRKNGKSLLPYKIISYEDYVPADIRDIEIFRLESAIDNEGSNYNVISKYQGIGVSEVSLALTGNVTKNIPSGSNAFLIRGIDGIFSYSGTNGEKNNIGFRNVISVDTEISSDNTEIFKITSISNDGGKISPSGNTIVKKGSTMIYSIIPDQGGEVIDVIVDGISVKDQLIVYGNYSIYKFENINANHTIEVLFDAKIGEYEVIVNKNPEGVGQVTGDGIHNSRSTVTLIADKKNGYKFSNWEIKEGLGNVVDLESNTITFVMPNNNVVLQANFVKLLETLLKVENLYGSVSMDKIINSDVKIKATENDEYGFTRWENKGIELTPEQIKSPCIEFKMPEDDVNLVAEYKKLYAVRRITGDGTIVETPHTEGSEVKIVAPALLKGQRFVRWEFKGITSPIIFDNEINFIMPINNVDIEAIYE